MTYVQRRAISLLHLKAGEIVELKQAQFLKNLRYVGKTFIQPFGSDISWWKYKYSIGGREFSIDDESLHELLLKYRKLVDTIILEAHEWHPLLTAANGSILYEDDAEEIPARNVEITNKTFFFILAIRTDEVEYYAEITRQEMITKAKIEQAAKEEDRQFAIELSNQWQRTNNEGSYEPSHHWEEYPDAYERSADELNGDFDDD